nr:MMPL family transporter [Chitinophagaceae bacterium]
MKKLFTTLYQLLEKHKILVYTLFFGLILIFAYLANQLKFDSDLNSMMPEGKGQQRNQIFTKNKSLEKIIVNVCNQDSNNINPDLLTAYAEEFSATLTSIDKQHLVSSIETKQNEDQMLSILQTVQDNLPFLLNQEDYQKITSQLNRDSVKSKLENSLHQLSTPNGLALKSFIQKDPLGMSFMALNKLKDLQQDEQTELYDGYVMTKDQRYLTFFIHTTYPASDTKHNEGLEELLSATQQNLSIKSEFKQIESSYFGGQLVAAGNALQMSKDTKLTLSITLALLLILFISFFRNWLAPFQIMIPVVFGGLFGMAVMYLIKGQVSLMALGASSVILGIAVNYSLHFMSHLKHAKSKEETIQELCEPMTIGSFTTIFAFLSLMLVHTPVLQELGLFTAMNLIGSSLCTLIFLPHFVQRPNQTKPHSTNWIEKLSSINLGQSKWAVLIIILLTLLLSFFMNDVKFNEDLMTMNFMQPKLATYQKEINQRNAESLNSVFCVSEGKNIDEAINAQLTILPQLNELKANQFIRKYSSPAQFLLSKQAQEQKISSWNQFWTKDKKDNLLRLIQEESTNLGFQSNAFAAFDQILNKNYFSTDSLYQQSFNQLFKDLIISNEKGVKVLSILKTSQDKRKELFESFKGNSQTYMIDKQSLSTQ